MSSFFLHLGYVAHYSIVITTCVLLSCIYWKCFYCSNLASRCRHTEQLFIFLELIIITFYVMPLIAVHTHHHDSDHALIVSSFFLLCTTLLLIRPISLLGTCDFIVLSAAFPVSVAIFHCCSVPYRVQGYFPVDFPVIFLFCNSIWFYYRSLNLFHNGMAK